MIDTKQIEIVKSTIPFLKENGNTLTELFYNKLFDDNPQLKDVFKIKTEEHLKKQANSLSKALLAYASNIDNLELIDSAINSIVEKHTNSNVTPEMYSVVGEKLIESLKEVLGDSSSDSIINAWTVAYTELANVFIEKEKTVYEARNNK